LIPKQLASSYLCVRQPRGCRGGDARHFDIGDCEILHFPIAAVSCRFVCMQHDEDSYPFIAEMAEKLGTYKDVEKGPEGKAPRRDVPPWDEYFHAIAQMVAKRSKDRDRQVGAVIVGEGHTILSTGFNGFARGVRETAAREADEEEKLFWVTHAETNAIFNAARHGVSLVGTTLYTTMYPCTGCAQAIIQAGIVRVFTYGKYWIKRSNRWEIAPTLFGEAKIAVDAPRIRARDAVTWTAAKVPHPDPGNTNAPEPGTGSF
jgi:dCMP deaminase